MTIHATVLPLDEKLRSDLILLFAGKCIDIHEGVDGSELAKVTLDMVACVEREVSRRVHQRELVNVRATLSTVKELVETRDLRNVVSFVGLPTLGWSKSHIGPLFSFAVSFSELAKRTPPGAAGEEEAAKLVSLLEKTLEKLETLVTSHP
jgi:hypothetical protein